MTRFNDPCRVQKEVGAILGKETAAYQEHFNDLCALLGQPSPAAADPTGSESFCFQKRVVKTQNFLRSTIPDESPRNQTRIASAVSPTFGSADSLHGNTKAKRKISW
jgi:hypothetical protein